MKRIFRQVPAAPRLVHWFDNESGLMGSAVQGDGEELFNLFRLCHHDVKENVEQLWVAFGDMVAEAAERLPLEMDSSEKVRHLTHVLVCEKWQALGFLKGRTRASLERRLFRLGSNLDLAAPNLLMYECGIRHSGGFKVVGAEILIGPVNPARLLDGPPK